MEIKALLNDFETLKSSLILEHYFPGDDVIQQGDIADSFYIIQSGELIVVNVDGDNEKVFDILGTGKCFLLEAYDTNDDTGRAKSELYRIIHSWYCIINDKRDLISLYKWGLSQHAFYYNLKWFIKKINIIFIVS